MFKNYPIAIGLKTAWRTIVRHKSHTVINVAGLAVSIAACLLLFTVITFEYSYNRFESNYNRIYRIITKDKFSDGINYTAGLPSPFAVALRADMPQLQVTNINTNDDNQFTILGTKGNSNADEKKFKETEGVTFADPEYFSLFDVKWLTGNPSDLSQPNMVVLDKSTAIKYFGDWKNATGQFIKMDNLVTLQVVGVVEDAPQNTDLSFKIYLSFVTCKEYGNQYGYVDDWHTTSSDNQVFVLLPHHVSATGINNLLKGFARKHFIDHTAGEKRIISLQPLSEMHFDSRYESINGAHIISKSILWTLSLIGVLIIIMASINFINLSTAQAAGRSKEVGIRKVLGSRRWQLINQVMIETFLIILISTGLATIIALLALPSLSHVSNVPKDISLFTVKSSLFLLLLIITISFLSGLYPAIIVSGFQPVVALKNKINSATVGGISLRRTLVVTQFAISQVLITGTIIAMSQMNFVHNADLGFNKAAVYMSENIADSSNLHKIDVLKQQLLQNPNIKSVSFTADAPSSDNDWSTNFYFNHSEKDPGFHTYLKFGDKDYIKTFGIHLLAGHGPEASDTMREIVINETLMHKLGYHDPKKIIGKDLRLGSQKWLPIVGVMKDFKTNSLHEEVKPIVLGTKKQFYFEIGMKLNTKNLSSTIPYIQHLWKQTYPEYVYTGYFLDDNIAAFYKQDNQMELLYKIFACLAIFISCLGLYGLISFIAFQKTKEVGIRKVLGASVWRIVYLFSKEFALLILIAFAIAVPVAWYLMHNWLQNFAYHIQLGIGVFAAAILVSLLIALITVSYRTIKAAVANPVDSLRSE